METQTLFESTVKDSAFVKFTSVQFSKTGEITINMDLGTDQLIRRIA